MKPDYSNILAILAFATGVFGYIFGYLALEQEIGFIVVAIYCKCDSIRSLIRSK